MRREDVRLNGTTYDSPKCINFFYQFIKSFSYSADVHSIFSYTSALCVLVLQILNTPPNPPHPQGHALTYLHFFYLVNGQSSGHSHLELQLSAYAGLKT